MARADDMAMEGLRALADAHRGLRMKALHDKKRGVKPAPEKPAEPAKESEDTFLDSPEFDALLKG